MSVSVLVVDDDPGFLALAARVLHQLGAGDVTLATDVASAIRQAEAGQPHAALVDVGLPDGDGIDLAYRLAALPWSPRVVLTSIDSDAVDAILRADARDALRFVPKEELAGDMLREFLLGD